jgi:long-subunit fatty acid transport protein
MASDWGFQVLTLMAIITYNYSEKPFIDVDGKIINYLQSSAVNIQFESKHKLSFIEVPVNVQYTFIDKAKFGLGLRFGFFNQFLTSILGQLPNAVFLDEQEKMTTENFKIRTSAWQTGLQLHYKINRMQV